MVLPNKWAFGYIPQLDAGLADLYARAIVGEFDEDGEAITAGSEPTASRGDQRQTADD